MVKEESAAIFVLRKSSGILDEDDIDYIILPTDDNEDNESNKNISTRYITRPSIKFTILKNIEKISDDQFKLYFLNDKIIDINRKDFDEDICGIKSIYEKKINILKTSVENSLSIAVDSFIEGFGLLKKMKDSYENTVLKKFFGKHSYILLINEDRIFVDINRDDVECNMRYLEDIGLCRNLYFFG